MPSAHANTRYLAIALAFGVSALHAADPTPALDTARIEALTGLKGTYSKEERVFKVSRPRDDIKVQVDHWPMPPFMGLTSWAAFTTVSKSQAMVMGDTVLLEDEVNSVMSAALDAGLGVTALHNHFFFDQPKVYFMHIAGTGPLDRLAGAVKKLYDKVTEIRQAHPTPETEFPQAIAGSSGISAGPLEAILAKKGQTSDGMFKVVFGRPARMHGVSIGNEMGVNTWAAFAGSDDQAVVDGDFAMSEDELQPVLRAMRAAGINIVAIHQHMTHEQPRIMFLHYWGKGRAVDLANAVRKALDAQHK